MKTAVHVATGLAALLAANAIASKADAAPLYAKVSVGETNNAAIEGVDLSDGFVYGGAVGTAVGPIRVEAGATHVSGEFANVVQVGAWDYAVSGYIDIPVSANSGVFFGGGADYISGEAQVFGSSLDSNGAGWHATAGLAHRFSPGLIGEVAYTHTEASLDSDYGSVDCEFDTVTAGLRVSL